MTVRQWVTAIVAGLLVAPPLRCQEPAPMGGHTGGECRSCHVSRNEQRYVFDTSRSTVFFVVRAFGLAPLTARISGVDGGFVYDANNLSRSSAVASIALAGLDAGDPLVSDVVRSERFLHTDVNPVLSFRSTRIVPAGNDRAEIRGLLRLGSLEREVSLSAHITRVVRHPLTGRDTVAVEATGRLRRSDFGMTLGLPAIEDDVAITIQAEGYRLQ